MMARDQKLDYDLEGTSETDNNQHATVAQLFTNPSQLSASWYMSSTEMCNLWLSLVWHMTLWSLSGQHYLVIVIGP